MSVNSNKFIEIFTISKTTTIIHNFLFTKRSNETFTHSIILDSILEILNKSFTCHKHNIHCTIISIFIQNITNSSFKFVESKIFAVSIVVTFTTDFQHTSSTRNWFTIISIFQTNSSIRESIISRQPQTFFVHYAHRQVELAHFF